MKKIFTATLALALCSSAYADDVKILSCGLGVPGKDEPQLMALGISPDGKYVCGAIQLGAGIFVANSESGEVKYLIVENDDGGELRNIDNNGVAIGFTDKGVTYSFETGELAEIEPAEGSRYFLGEALTNDGSMYVGSMVGSTFNTKAIYKKAGGEWTYLPIPAEDELGGLSVNTNISAAKCVSADGKVILGYLGSFSVPIVWFENEAGEYEADFFPVRYLKTTEEDVDNPDKPLYSVSAMYLNVSNNGRYISMLGLIKDDADQYLDVPVIYDTQERELIIYSEKQQISLIDDSIIGLYPIAICDDGTFIGTIGMPYYESHGSFIMKAGETQAQKFNDAFPAFKYFLGESDSLGFNIPTGLSADGRYIVGYTFTSENFNDQTTPAYYVSYILDVNGESSIESIPSESSDATPEAIYSIDGYRLDKMTKGLNIIRMSDGTTRKVINK